MRVCWLLLTLAAVSALAHDFEVTVRTTDEAVIARATYGDQGPAPDAYVAVYAPGEPMNEYQTGQTDRNGYFSFVPGGPGDWEIVIDDGTGHRDRKTVSISAGSPPESEASALPASQPTWQKLLIGLSLILGLSGFFYGISNRRAQR
jgi:nickel transport protein